MRIMNPQYHNAVMHSIHANVSLNKIRSVT